MANHILLVEDDRELGQQVAQGLQEVGYQVTWWQEGQRLLQGQLDDFQLVILDLMLPAVHGLDMLKDLRSFSEVPVLVLSARDMSDDKVRALKLGADDYLTKPFWPQELIERVRARLRRPLLQVSKVQSFGSLTIDRSTREVSIDGETLELTKIEFDLLAALAERPNQPLTRRHLADQVLDPDRDATDRTVDVHISRLRKKMGSEGPIQTVWGVGYRLSWGSDKK